MKGNSEMSRIKRLVVYHEIIRLASRDRRGPVACGPAGLLDVPVVGSIGGLVGVRSQESRFWFLEGFVFRKFHFFIVSLIHGMWHLTFEVEGGLLPALLQQQIELMDDRHSSEQHSRREREGGGRWLLC